MAHEGGRLNQIGAVIDLDGLPARSVSREYATILEILLKRFGRPGNSYEQGEFVDPLTENIALGKFARTLEWTLPDGVLRLGFPQQIDQKLRLEVQKASSFGSPRDTLWGMPGVN
ncbi:MAG: hypothetical protein IPI58_01415 [Alphaproteobacteria bacterium]|nr:MAG: hypothetical protein IPI58_01415 [Alphaproteobacteria bacterium]